MGNPGSKVFFNVLQDKKDITLKKLLQWHKEIFEESKDDIAGKLRDYSVKVGDYRAPEWQDLPKLIKEFFLWYKKSRSIMHPIELAARAHYKFEKIHPFGDGNGRIGRLMIAHTLYRNNFPLLIIQYKKRRTYYRALEKSENDFMNYFIRRYLRMHK